MLKHQQQSGDNCAPTAAANVCGCDAEGYENILHWWKNKKGTLENIAPILMVHGWMFGTTAGFGATVISEDVDKNTITVGVDRELLAAIAGLAAIKSMKPGEYLTELMADHLNDKGIKPVEINYSYENGLDGESLTTKKSFLVEIPMNLPALVVVNTQDEVGHVVFWDGSKLLDSNHSEPQCDFSGYSIRQWVPVRKIGDPLDGWIDLMDHRKKTADYNRRVKLDMQERSKRLPEMTIKLSRACFVRCYSGKMLKGDVGDEVIVAVDDGLNMVRIGSAVEING